jgi:hypothetical protein
MADFGTLSHKPGRNEVIVGIDIHFVSDLAPADQEWSPSLVTYLPSTFNRNAVSTVLPDDPSEKISILVRGKYDKNKLVHQDTRINFQLYATQENKYGAPCDVDVGYASIPLYDVCRAVEECYERGSTKANICTDLDVCMRIANGLKKGELHVKIDINNVYIGEDLHWEPSPVAGEDILKNAKINEQAMVRYATDTLNMTRDIPLTYTATKNIRCPFYPSECSPIRGAMALPAFSYMMYEPVKSDALFWHLAMRNVMSRMPGELHPCDYESLPVKQQASIMVRVCCHMTQGFDYVSDTVNTKDRRKDYRFNSMANGKESVENFGDALRTLSGDCEDLANSICQVHTSLVECRKIKKSSDSMSHLVALRKMAKRYAPLMSLDGVTASHIQNDVKKEKAQNGVTQYKKLGAHMNVNFLPLWYHRACLARGGSKIPVEYTLPRDSVDKELGVLIGEGTGMFDPDGLPDPVKQERSYCCFPHNREGGSYKCMQSLKKPINHDPREESSFYKVAKIAWGRLPTGEASGVTYAKCHTRYYGGHPKHIVDSIGVSFKELRTMQQSVALIAHLPQSESLSTSIKSVISNRVPGRPLYGVDRHILGPSHCEARANLQKLQDEMTKWGRPARPSRLNIKANPVDVYGPAHCFNKKWLEQAKEHFSGAEWVMAIDWECEPCTKDYYLYKVQLWTVPPEVANKISAQRRDGVQLDLGVAYGMN